MLAWTVYISFLGVLVLMLLPRDDARSARKVALLTAIAGFAAALIGAQREMAAAKLEQPLINMAGGDPLSDGKRFAHPGFLDDFMHGTTVTLDGSALFRHPDNAELRNPSGEDEQEAMALLLDHVHDTRQRATGGDAR